MDESETPPEVAAILRQEVESGIAAQNGSIGEFVVSSVGAEEIGKNVTMFHDTGVTCSRVHDVESIQMTAIHNYYNIFI